MARSLFALFAKLVRNIHDSARRRRTLKRRGDAQLVDLRSLEVQVRARPEVILEVDRLLWRLKVLDNRQAQVVEVRYFAGLSEEEIATALEISERMVKRDWNMARMRKERACP